MTVPVEEIDSRLDALDLNRPHPSTHGYLWDDSDSSELTDLDDSDPESTRPPTSMSWNEDHEEGEISDNPETLDRTQAQVH